MTWVKPGVTVRGLVSSINSYSSKIVVHPLLNLNAPSASFVQSMAAFAVKKSTWIQIRDQKRAGIDSSWIKPRMTPDQARDSKRFIVFYQFLQQQDCCTYILNLNAPSASFAQSFAIIAVKKVLGSR